MRKGFMWRRPSLQKAVLRTLWSLFRSNGKRIPMRTQINYGMFCWSIENQMPCSEEVSAAVWASGRNRLRRRPDWSALPATLRCTTWMWSHLHSKMPFENRPRSWRVSVQESLRSNEERLQKGSQMRQKMLWRVRWLQRKVETKLALWTFNFHWMLSQRWRHLLLVSLLFVNVDNMILQNRSPYLGNWWWRWYRNVDIKWNWLAPPSLAEPNAKIRACASYHAVICAWRNAMSLAMKPIATNP